MSDDRSNSVVCSVIKLLERNNIKLQKVTLHKFIYFLNTQGFVTNLKFEPYTYGPYSFDLASVLGSMSFWDAIKDDGACIQVLDLERYEELDADEMEEMSDLLISFKKIAGDMTFSSLECVGTVLYCAQALAFQNYKITSSKILEEFKQWKGTKYSDDTILDAFDKLRPYLKVQQ